MKKTVILSEDNLQLASDLLKKGELVAFPTETVYGLGARIDNESALLAIFAAKNRPADNPLIAHFSDLTQLDWVAEDIPPIFYKLFAKFSPGPLTFVLKKHSSLSLLVTGGLDKVAVRMPNHPIALKLIDLTGVPLVGPSANISSRPSPTSSAHVLFDLVGRIAAIVEGGECAVGIESTVIDLTGEVPRLLRPGVITAEEIESAIGVKIERVLSGKNLPSPGMRYRHYAPNAAVHLFDSVDAIREHLQKKEVRAALFASKECAIEGVTYFPLSEKSYYAALRTADALMVDEILILCDEQIKTHAGLMNRITRSAHG